MMVVKRWCGVLVLLAGACAVWAVPIEVGSGENMAGIYIEWKDGFSAEFLVRFEEESISGLELIQGAAAETALTVVVRSFVGFGYYVDGIAFAGHSNEGSGGGVDDWWHYWIKDAADNWVDPGIGASGRVVMDGDWDGWVYGRADIPEPATLVLVGVGVLLIRRRSTATRRADAENSM